MPSKKPSCPRCASTRLIERIDGSKTCRRCGQKWLGKKVFASQDKRKPSKVLPGRSLSKPAKKKQLSLF
jgi:ribosomal protein L37AE/L43A